MGGDFFRGAFGPGKGAGEAGRCSRNLQYCMCCSAVALYSKVLQNTGPGSIWGTPAPGEGGKFACNPPPLLFAHLCPWLRPTQTPHLKKAANWEREPAFLGLKCSFLFYKTGRDVA